jgi:hypothetical protein
MGPGNGTSFRLGPQCTGSELNVLFCPLQKKWAEDVCNITIRPRPRRPFFYRKKMCVEKEVILHPGFQIGQLKSKT